LKGDIQEIQSRYSYKQEGGVSTEGKFSFKPPDFSSSRILMGAYLVGKFKHNDSLSVDYQVSRYRYNTPDTTNFDDRDELRYKAGLQLFYTIFPGFRIILKADLFLNHYVYIYAQKSANNYWNRVFRILPIIEFSPQRNLKLLSSYQILSNYYDYDFQDSAYVSVNSMIFRNYISQHEISWEINPYDRVSYRLQIEHEENGDLDWNKFVEEIKVTRKILTHEFMWTHSILQLKIGLGFGYNSRREWDWQNNQRQSLIYRLIGAGPRLSIQYKNWMQASIRVENVKLLDGTTYRNKKGNIRLFYRF
jgi:hypothetical protein